MTNTDIYALLASKPHNPHYLNRYWKFIQSCQKSYSIGYTENHHICSKSSDLFPEYSDIKINPWNNICLTDRQHFLAHWLLWKSYGGKQTFSFRAMANNQNAPQAKRSKKKINSKTYSILKQQGRAEARKTCVGKATYRDSLGNSVYCSTKDPRVISGEFTSTTKGRSSGVRTEEWSKRCSSWIIESKWIKYPNRKINLYFLDIKIVLHYTRETELRIFEYIAQGWTKSITPEFRTALAIISNRNRSAESRARAAVNISKARLGKLYPKSKN